MTYINAGLAAYRAYRAARRVRAAARAASGVVSRTARGRAVRTAARRASTTAGGTITTTRTRRGIKTAKARGGVGTTTRRKRYTKTQGNMADYSKTSLKTGKELSTLMKTMKLVSGSTEKTRWSWRNLNRFGGISGAMALSPVQVGASGTIVSCPLHIYDITSVVNYNDTSAVTPVVARALNFSNEASGSTVTWTNLSNHISTTSWESVDAPAATPGRLEGGAAFLDYVSLKMLLYPATAIPGKFQIDLISFDPAYVPGAYGDDIPFGSSTQQYAAFWQYMIKKWIFNPIDEQNSMFKRFYTIHKSCIVEMDPKETQETSTNRYKEVSWFMRLNRRLNYRWLESDTVALAINDNMKNTAANQAYVHPKARLFVMVRALAPFVGANGTSTTANTPSYDIVLQKQHLNLNGNTL